MILSHFQPIFFGLLGYRPSPMLYGGFYIYTVNLPLQQIVSCLKDKANRFRRKTVESQVQTCTKICPDFQTPRLRHRSLDFIAGSPAFGSICLESTLSNSAWILLCPGALQSPQLQSGASGDVAEEDDPLSRASSFFSSYFELFILEELLTPILVNCLVLTLRRGLAAPSSAVLAGVSSKEAAHLQLRAASWIWHHSMWQHLQKKAGGCSSGETNQQAEIKSWASSCRASAWFAKIWKML